MKSTFSNVLSRLRREAAYSQRKVATDLGISQALLSHYENGAREPKLDFVIKACDYYKVSADFILGRSDEREDTSFKLLETLGVIVGELQEARTAEDAIVEKLKQLAEVI